MNKNEERVLQTVKDFIVKFPIEKVAINTINFDDKGSLFVSKEPKDIYDTTGISPIIYKAILFINGLAEQ